MDETTLLDQDVRLVLYRLGIMEKDELNSFIQFGQNVYDCYKDNILQNAYLNKYLEPLEEMPPEKRQAFLYAVIVLHGMCDAENRLKGGGT